MYNQIIRYWWDINERGNFIVQTNHLRTDKKNGILIEVNSLRVANKLVYDLECGRLSLKHFGF